MVWARPLCLVKELAIYTFESRFGILLTICAATHVDREGIFCDHGCET